MVKKSKQKESDTEKGDVKYSDLFNAWWSIFAPLRLFKWLTSYKRTSKIFTICYVFFLIIMASTMTLPILSFINNLLICRRDTIHVVSSTRNLCSIASVVAMIFAAWFGRNCSESFTRCPDSYGEITAYIDQIENKENPKFTKCFSKSKNNCLILCGKICAKFSNFIWNFFYTWVFLFAIVGYFTLAIPYINPFISFSEFSSDDDLILTADFILASIRIYHNQFFCIICHRLCKKVKYQLKPIIDEVELSTKSKSTSIEHQQQESIISDQDVEKDISEERIQIHLKSPSCQQKADHKNLILLMQRCIHIKSVISVIDKKIRWFTLIGAIEFIMGLSGPFLLLLYDLKTKELSLTLFIVFYSPWLFFRFGFVFYSVFKAYQISSTYRSYIARYKNAIYSRLICTACSEFKSEFNYANTKFFKKSPSLTLGGFLNLGSPPVCTIISIVKLCLSFSIVAIILDRVYDYEPPKSVKNYYFSTCLDMELLNETLID